MPTIIDRYMLRQFLQVLAICFLSLAGLYIVIDAFNHLDHFVDFADTYGSLLATMGKFYAYRSLAFFDWMSGTMALVAAMFTVTWIQRHHEMTALLAAGIPRLRVLRPVLVAAILVSPSSVTVAAGSVVTLTATAQDQYGNALPFGVLTWAASAGTLLQLATDGRLVQYSAPTESGPETLTVSSGTVSRTVSVSVVAGPAAAIVLSGPASVQAGSAGNAYMATATDAYGNAVAAASIVWSTTSGSISTAGVLTAPTTAGTIVITAQAGGRQATVVVQVTAAAVDHLEVSPTSVSVQTGAGTLLSVVGRDQYGNAVSGLSYTWTTTIGTIVPGPNGGATASFFSGDAGGSGTITVSAAGETASVGVTVSESSLPLVRQATSPTSLLFLVVAILAIAASIFLYGRYRAAQGEIEEMRKGGQGGGQTGGPGDVG